MERRGSNSVQKHGERLRKPKYYVKARAATGIKILIAYLLKLGSIYFTSTDSEKMEYCLQPQALDSYGGFI